jgi:hypothetical protein
MKATTILAIIFGPLIVGALLPLVFGKALQSVESAGQVCATLDSATKRGFIDAAARKKLVDEALKVPGLDAKAAEAFEGARTGC